MTKNAMGLTLLAGFFAFGATACFLTTLTLLFPGSALDVLWRLNPAAENGFRGIGRWAFLLMAVVGTVCTLTAIGLAKRLRWGRILAIALLAANLVGDLGSAIFRHDYSALIGLPIGGALILYLMSDRVRRSFSTSSMSR